MNPYRDKNLNEFLQNIPQNTIDYETSKQDIENQKVHEKFIRYLQRGKCSLCEHSIDSFIINEPCFHWLLLPNGITKKDVVKYLNNEISFYQLESYLRWIANTELFIGNISDLDEDKPVNCFICETIKYRNIEWTINVGEADKEGHENSLVGNKPHYHLQILRDNKIFIKFNDVHIRFTDNDLFTMECISQGKGIFKFGHTYGEGISILEEASENGWINELDAISKNVDDPSQASIHRQTIITAPPGKTISGDDFVKAVQESKVTKEPVGKIMSRINSELQITTILEPSENVPELKKRTKRG